MRKHEEEIVRHSLIVLEKIGMQP